MMRFCSVVIVISFFLTILVWLNDAYPYRAEAAESLEEVVVTPCGYEGGGRFTAVAVSPEDSKVLLVGSDVAGVFKSTDEGKTFRLKGKGLEGFAVADIAFHPEDPARVFLLTRDGLYGSRDQGESWKKENSEVRYESRFFGSQLMVFLKDALWVAADRNGVFQVRFEGSPWSTVAVPGLEGIKVNALAIFRGLIHAATERGVFRLADGRWHNCSQGLPADRREVFEVASHPNGRLYLVERASGLYVWNESQEMWERRGLGLGHPMTRQPTDYKALAVHPQNPDIVFMATYPEVWPHFLYESADGGRSWKTISSFHFDPHAPENFTKDLEGIEEIAFSPAEPQNVFLTDWSNVWHSRDAGLDWMQLHKGLQNTVVDAIKIHPFDTQKIYLALADNGLVVSQDGGKSWKRKMKGVLDGHGRAVAISHKNPSRMYLLMNPWRRKDRIFVYKSSDSGDNWEDISFPVPPGPLPQLGYVDGQSTNLVLDPLSDEVVYVGTNGYGIFKTIDGGKTWQAINRGITTPYIKGPNAILIDPRNSRVLYASTLQGGVYKTIDGGENWTAVGKQYPFTFGMAMDLSNPSRVFAGRPEKKILVSENAGQTWKEISLPGGNPAHIASHAVAVHPLNPKIVVVGTLAYKGAADGVFMSTNGGYGFSKVSLDLPEINVFAVEIVKSEALRFFVGFNGSGAFQCDLAAGVK